MSFISRILQAIRKEFLQLFTVFIALMLLILASYLLVSRIVERQIFNSAQLMLQTAETTIHDDLRDAEVALITTSLFIEQRLNLGWTEENIKNYLIWQNNALASDEAAIKGYYNIFCYMDSKFFSGQGDWIPPDDFDPQTRSWYIEAEKAQGKIGYSPIYNDFFTGETIFSLTRMMGDPENRWFLGLDIQVDSLFNYVLSLQSEVGGYGILADRNFTMLVHPNTEFIGLGEGSVSPGHSDLVEKFKNNTQGVIVQQISNWKGIGMVLVSKQLFNGWHLSIATPAKQYYSDVYFMALILVLIGFAALIVLDAFLIRLSLLKDVADEESKDKTSFLARMSHEIRTPMSSILGMTELIQRKSISSEVKEYIEIIQQAGFTLLAIINDVLDFSKIESNRLKIDEKFYHFSSICNDIINVIRPRAAEKSLDFFVSVDSAIPFELFGDDVRLRQILINLLSNAVKYTRKGFIALNIKMEKIGHDKIKLIFTVTDSGMGIKQEDIGKLFSEFSRVDVKANQGIEGTGLGLVIAKGLCRAMGGDISVTSEYEIGSVFEAEIVQHFKSDQAIAVVQDSEHKRVLFFDWRPQYVTYLAQSFENLNINAVCAPSFLEFIQALEEGEYDYAFISSKFAMDCIHIIGKGKTSIQLIVLVELGEVAVFRDINNIMFPVYSIPLAHVLNGKNGDDHGITRKTKFDFTAPSAFVLITDDINTNLRVAKELMSPYNMNVHTAQSGLGAIELIKQNHYDIIFMDHMMPVMDGIETTARIRAIDHTDEYYKNVPIIALTANAISGQREMFLENGMDDFLAKPIDIQKLDAILEKWLPEEKLQRTNASVVSENKTVEKNSFSISGVDTETGLRNIGGSEAGYIDILYDFCRDVENRENTIATALAVGDTKLYITLVHALKGAARSIGAMELGDAAAYLESAAETQSAEVIKAKTAELFEITHFVINNIKIAIESRQCGEDTKCAMEALHLETLKTALAAMDIEEVNKILLEYANMQLGTKTREMISEVEEHILMFEYDKAIEKIDQLF